MSASSEMEPQFVASWRTPFCYFFLAMQRVDITTGNRNVVIALSKTCIKVFDPTLDVLHIRHDYSAITDLQYREKTNTFVYRAGDGELAVVYEFYLDQAALLYSIVDKYSQSGRRVRRKRRRKRTHSAVSPTASGSGVDDVPRLVPTDPIRAERELSLSTMLVSRTPRKELVRSGIIQAHDPPSGPPSRKSKTSKKEKKRKHKHKSKASESETVPTPEVPPRRKPFAASASDSSAPAAAAATTKTNNTATKPISIPSAGKKAEKHSSAEKIFRGSLTDSWSSEDSMSDFVSASSGDEEEGSSQPAKPANVPTVPISTRAPPAHPTGSPPPQVFALLDVETSSVNLEHTARNEGEMLRREKDIRDAERAGRENELREQKESLRLSNSSVSLPGAAGTFSEDGSLNGSAQATRLWPEIHYGDLTVRLAGFGCLTINEDPVPFESEGFKGEVLVRVRDAVGAPACDDYFGGKSRLFSILVTGCFKKEYRGDELYSGAMFSKGINPPLGSSLGLKFARVIDPSVETDLSGDTPYLRSPLLTSMNEMSGPGVDGMDSAYRRSYYKDPLHRQEFHFPPGERYSFELFGAVVDWNTFDVSLGPLCVNIKRYLCHQPAPFQVKSVLTGEILWSVEFHHREVTD